MSTRGSSPSVLPATAAIEAADLQQDLLVLAGDAMRGRETGTLDELRASAWLAQRAAHAGLEPAGDDGTYFQFWPLRRLRLSATSAVTIGGARLALVGSSGSDSRVPAEAVVLEPVPARITTSLVFLGQGRESDLVGRDVRGKAVAVVLSPPAQPAGVEGQLGDYLYTILAIHERATFLRERGAAALVIVSDSVAESQFEYASARFARGRYAIDSVGAGAFPSDLPVIWVRQGLLNRVKTDTLQTFAADLAVESFIVASVNVVARVPGTDPMLRREHVLFSAHQDHDGTRFPVQGDSIWNGADDNATGSVALLAIGRAFRRQPGRRSALFVWHGAEERGLFGSAWYVRHSTVPRTSIVAVLNADMIGRNHPDSASLTGIMPPHRNSTALVEMALKANAQVAHFVIDSTWDRPTHPETWYFRSDHLPYARANIPAVFFSSLPHPDYHTPKDEPARIDIQKLARITRWMYATGWLAANATQRPAVDSGFKLGKTR